MRHIDDGALHAYLDGAHALIGVPGGVDALETHLAECAACRARLEAERAVRDRTAAILGMGSPTATELPPFAALEGRRERGRPRLRGRVPLAWAATVVLAVGAGWIAREVLESPAEQRLSAVTAVEPEARPLDAEVARPGVNAASPATPAGAGDTTFGRGGAARSEAVLSARGGEVPAAADRPAPADRVASAQPDAAGSAFAQAGKRQEAVIVAAPPPVSESRAAAPASARTGGLHAHVTADEAAETERSRERREQQSPVIGEPLSDTRYPQAAAAPPPPPPPPVSRIEEVEMQEIIVTGAAGAAAAEEPLWRPIDRRAAEAALGRPILVVAGLPVIAIEQPAAGPITTVRVRQRLPTGGVLTLQQSLVESIDARGDRAAVAAAAPRAAEPEHAAAADRPSLREIEAREEPGGARMELRAGDLVVHARAPIPLDRLRALLARLR